MTDLLQALRGAQHRGPAPVQPLGRLLVVGGGGTLGSAVLAEALVAGRFAQVLALVAEPISSAMRGFVPLDAAALARGDSSGADAAVLVLERQRHSNGRDDAFAQVQVDDLLPLAQQMRHSGVKRLIVVVPHAPALMPQALARKAVARPVWPAPNMPKVFSQRATPVSAFLSQPPLRNLSPHSGRRRSNPIINPKAKSPTA